MKSGLPFERGEYKLKVPVDTRPETGAFVRSEEGESVLSLKDLFRIVWKRKWTIIITMVVAVGIAVGFSLLQTPQYEASVRILVAQKSGIAENPSNVTGLEQLTQTMADAVVTRPVAQETIQRLDLDIATDELLDNLSSSQVAGTQFIEVNYTDADPETARSVANTVGEVFSERISEVSPDASAVTATVWEQSAVPENPVSPEPVSNAALALVLGAILGGGLAFLLEYLDDSWRSPEEAEQISGVPTFGIIPRFDVSKDRKAKRDKKDKRRDVSVASGLESHQDGLFSDLVVLSEPDRATTEALRVLRTNLFYAVVDNPPRTIVLTSPGAREGKSTICANLGVALAQADKRTLIVDCDFRRPGQHKIFRLRNLQGIVNVLVGERDLNQVLQDSPVPNLKVVTVGPLPPDPAELLGSRRFAEVLDQARQEFDYVLLDTPPIQLVSDPMVLASQGDGVLLVLDSQNTRKNAVRQSMRSLEAVGANVLGTVMNKTESSDGGQYYGGYTYGYTR